MASLNYKMAAVTVVILAGFLCVANAKPSHCSKYQMYDNCECTQLSHEIVMSCPMHDYEVKINYKPGDYLNLACEDNHQFANKERHKSIDLNQLPRFEDPITLVKKIQLEGCPLPETSYSDIFTKLGLEAIDVIIRKGNFTNNLQKKHLNGLGRVNVLCLFNDGITDLPSDVFDDMTNLTRLHMSNNKINFTKELVQNLKKLIGLELTNNPLSNLEDGAFAELKNLTRLQLWQDRIEEIAPGAFRGLEKLESLDLNVANSIPDEIFSDLKNLREIALTVNYSTLPDRLFENNTKLQRIKIRANYNITSVSNYLFANLPELEEVVMDNCKVENVPANAFENSFKLSTLSFAHNQIKTLPTGIFDSLVNLKYLFLNKNQLTYLPSNLFAKTVKIEEIKLDNNLLNEIDKNLFSPIINLKKLFLQKNNLTKISTEAFENKKLEVIDLSYNFLDLLADSTQYNIPYITTPFNKLSNIRKINLSHNLLTQISYDDWRLVNPKLESLNLTHNRITEIMLLELNFISQYLEIDMRNNNISIINFSQSERFVTDSDWKEAEQIRIKLYIDQNPINCDCQLYDFIQFLNNKLNPILQSNIEVISGSARCATPSMLKDTILTSVDPRMLTCPLDDPNSNSPKQCPDECRCDLRSFDKALIVNCSNEGIDYIPRLPNVTNFNCDYLELDMENNNLNEIRKGMFNDDVKKINLRGNNLTRLEIGSIPSTIEVLDLRDNHLSYINESLAERLFINKPLMNISFSGNPIVCDCKNSDFLRQLQLNYMKVTDRGHIKCSDNVTSVFKLQPTSLCAASSNVIAGYVCIGLMALIAIFFVIFYYKYNQEIKIFLFSRGWCLWFVTEEELDHDKKYDIFISFSQLDEAYVKELVDRLESGDKPYKICIHSRDWPVGGCISKSITESVENSRRTIVVLSKNYQNSPWGKEEFRVANTKTVQERCPRVIMILHGEVDIDSLDADLQSYIKTNTYIKSNDKWFWERLKYALPHPTLVRNNNVDDKLELITSSTQGSPTTPVAQGYNNPVNGHIIYPTQNGGITMNGLKVNGNAKHSEV